MLVFQEHSSECFLYAIIDVQFHNRNISVENRLKDPLKLIRDWLYANLLYSCADPESFVRGGPTLTRFFVFLRLMRGGRIQILLLSGHLRRFAGGPMKAQH